MRSKRVSPAAVAQHSGREFKTQSQPWAERMQNSGDKLRTVQMSMPNTMPNKRKAPGWKNKGGIESLIWDRWRAVNNGTTDGGSGQKAWIRARPTGGSQ